MPDMTILTLDHSNCVFDIRMMLIPATSTTSHILYHLGHLISFCLGHSKCFYFYLNFYFKWKFKCFHSKPIHSNDIILNWSIKEPKIKLSSLSNSHVTPFNFYWVFICGLYIRTIRKVHRLNFHILKFFEFKFWIERSINPVLTDSSFGFIKFNLSSTLRKKNEKYKHWTTYAYSVKFRTLDSLFVRLGMKNQDLKTN